MSIANRGLAESCHKDLQKEFLPHACGSRAAAGSPYSSLLLAAGLKVSGARALKN